MDLLTDYLRRILRCRLGAQAVAHHTVAFKHLFAAGLSRENGEEVLADIVHTESVGKKLGECLIENHINCTSMLIEFGYIPAGDYLITFTDFELKIGGYDATAVAAPQKGHFEYFVDGEKTDEMIPQLKMVLLDNSNPPEITEEPTPEETPTPEVTEVPVTEQPENTDTPSGTEEPGKPTEAPTPEPVKRKGCGSVLTSFGGLALVLAGCFVISKKRR